MKIWFSVLIDIVVESYLTLLGPTRLLCGFPRQGCWSRLSFPSSGDLPDLGIEPMSLQSPALENSLPLCHLEAHWLTCIQWIGHYHIYSVQFSSVVSDSLQPRCVMQGGLQHARPPCPSPTPGVYSNSRPLSRWCHPTISSSVVPFSSCPQSFPASGSFPLSQLLASGGQSIGVSASPSVLSMNTQGWSPLGWTDWISLQSKGLSRIFVNTTVQKHQFLGAQLSL